MSGIKSSSNSKKMRFNKKNLTNLTEVGALQIIYSSISLSIVPALSSAATAEEKRRRRHSSHHTTVLSVTTPGGGVGFPSADADAAAAALAAAARSQRRGSACVVATSPRAEAKFSNPV